MITLTKDQENGIKKAREWYISNNLRPFVILGIAGSGKTTIVKFLIEELGLSIESGSVVFCTFTGKAASVMTNKGTPAQTIHRLIYDPVEVVDEKTKKKKIIFTLKDSLPQDIEVIVVDEFFMVSKEIMENLLSFNKKVICLGDQYQLPPPFGTINELYKHPDVVLDEPLRQSLDSPIIYLANEAKKHNRIKYGKYDNILVTRKNDSPLDRLRASEQIIAGKNATVKKLNNFYRRNILNIKAPIPTKGEKLMCLKNNWNQQVVEDGISTNLVNGLTVVLENEITDINTTLQTTEVDLRPDFFNDHCFKKVLIDMLFFKYNYNKLDEIENEDCIKNYGYQDVLDKRKLLIDYQMSPLNALTYGYVITCHKSQGSEFKDVFYFFEPMGKQTYWQLLYTGITRASENLTLVI